MNRQSINLTLNPPCEPEGLLLTEDSKARANQPSRRERPRTAARGRDEKCLRPPTSMETKRRSHVQTAERGRSHV